MKHKETGSNPVTRSLPRKVIIVMQPLNEDPSSASPPVSPSVGLRPTGLIEQLSSYVSTAKVDRGSFSVRNDIICPRCGLQHVDRGDWAKRLHRKHLCERCGCIWQPEDGYSFGI